MSGVGHPDQPSQPSQPSRVVLEARDLVVRLGGATILDGVDVAVRGGELLALVGPNGAGKSTLLAALTGDLTPARGEVLLNGERVSGIPVATLARERAVLSQQHQLSFGFRVSEVVRMGRAPWHRTPAEDRDDRVVAASMVRTDVDHLAERVFPSLSGGEQARASLARVLAQEARVLMLDEPTAALDIRHQESALRVAREAAQAGCAVIVVLHDLSLAASYADRICLLADGRVAADGSPTDVLTSERVSAVYHHPVDVLVHHGSVLVVPVREEVSR